MKTMSELILKLTALAELAGEQLVIKSHSDTQNAYAGRYTITIGDSIYYAACIDTSSLVDALMYHALNLKDKIASSVVV